MLIRQIPNILTGLNLLIGCIGITLVFSDKLYLASFCIIISALLDFLDGFIAKLLNAHSSFGKEFDSLADIVSFGVLPATIVYIYMSQASVFGIPAKHDYLAYLAFLIVVFSALRLSKFNINNKYDDHFSGLPTPANALFISSFPLIAHYGLENHFLHCFAYSIINSFNALLLLTIISSTLLILPLKMLSLKFKSWKLKKNLLRYIIIVFAVISLAVYNFMAIPLIMGFYIFLSILNQIFEIDKNL